MLSTREPIITTIREKCKICYTCIRECPAKAIKVERGQAAVMGDRCIHCGNCVKICGQKAKQVLSFSDEILTLLRSKDVELAAILAPSFPAEFYADDYHQVVGSLRKLGFKYVHEVGFGADLVAIQYEQLLKKNPSACYISSTCPAVVSYIEKYHENLISHLAPIVSPMLAMSKVINKIYGEKVQTIFIGPCIAKKEEFIKEKGEHKTLRGVLTFNELRELFRLMGIEINRSPLSEFDPPHSHHGGLFAVSSGLLQASMIKEDLLEGNIINADGKANFLEALKEFSRGEFRPHFLDTLCCEGCIMGPGINKDIPLYKKRAQVSHYVKNHQKRLSKLKWKKAVKSYFDLDLTQTFSIDPQIMQRPPLSEIKEVLIKLGKIDKMDELNCGACGYDTCEGHAVAIIKGWAESEMCLPYTIEKLKNTVHDLEMSYSELKNIKETLNHREKLASMGQLSAGVAHELNNPLGVVLMYAHIIMERDDIDQEMKKDLQMIVEQSNRCKRIVSGLLNFSRQSKVIRTAVDLKKLTQRAIDSLTVSDDIQIVIKSEMQNPIMEIDRDQISQVLINLLNNSLDALEGNQGKIEIILKEEGKMVAIIVNDNGPGIPEKVKGHIFDPFFTTKQIGKGTGLGLPVSYGIIKMHHGMIDVISNAESKRGPVGTSVIVKIPRTEDAIL